MAINVSDAVKTAFGSLKTDVGQKLIGIFFLIQLINLGSTYLIETGSFGLQLTGATLSLIAALATIAATIGGLRAFRETSLDKELFTENILWPFGRTLGANLTTGIFAYLIGAIFLLPAFIAVLGGAGTMTGGLENIGTTGILGLLLGIAGVILGVAAFIYIAITLLLSQPLIAIEDKRMFQALDESIQRTKGSRLNIFLTGLVIFAVYAAALAIGGLAIIANEPLGTALIQLAVVPLFTPIFLAVLNHFSEELPLP